MSRGQLSLWPVAHFAAFAGVAAFTVVCLPRPVWPWYLLLPLLVYGALVAWAVAVGVTAVCFGAGHWSGYPPGLPGALLAGLYGLALGLLRRWCGGLGLPIACHVCAGATVFGIVMSG